MGSNYNELEEFGGGMYRGHDWDHHLVCYNCRRYSVFMFYLGDIEKARAIYPDVHMGELILCSECVPVQAEYEHLFPGERAYREDSILNNREILELLDNYCYNAPTFGTYAHLERLILTSNVMLVENYKSLFKRPLPKTKKIKVLMAMFPKIHRFRNQKFASVREAIGAVKAKYSEVRAHYRNLPEAEASRYHDQYDVMLYATPRHQRASQNRAAPQEPVNSVVQEPQNRALDVTNNSVDVTVSSTSNSVDMLRHADDSDSSDDSMQSVGGRSTRLIRTPEGPQQRNESSQSVLQVSSQERPGNLSSQGSQQQPASSQPQPMELSSEEMALEDLANVADNSSENPAPSDHTYRKRKSPSQPQPGTSRSSQRSPAAASQNQGRRSLDSSGESAAGGNVSSSQENAQISSQNISGAGINVSSSQGSQPTASQPASSQSQEVQISSEEIDLGPNSLSLSPQPTTSQQQPGPSQGSQPTASQPASSQSQEVQISSEEIDLGPNPLSLSPQPTTSQQQPGPSRRSQRSPAAASPGQGRHSPPQLDSSGESSSQEMAQISSQEIAQISSQNISQPGINPFSQGSQPTASQQQQAGSSQSQPAQISSEDIGLQNNALDSSSGSSVSSDRSRRKRRSTDSEPGEPDDDHRPGPSRTKRARPRRNEPEELPMNSSPEEFVANPGVGRMPRLGGG